MKKVLITGIGGFAGSHLRDFLLTKKDLTVFGTDLRKSDPAQNPKALICTVDLTDYHGVVKIIAEIKPDYIFHLAALTSPAKSFSHPYDTLENNIKAEINLLEAVKNEKLKARILIIGSGDEYGLVKPEENPVSENQPLRPTSPYAVSKITQDFLALQYALTYKMDIVRVRPFNHIGPRQSPGFVVCAFAKQIAEIEKGKKKPVISVGNLSAVRDFTDVHDMVEAYYLTLLKGKTGEVYNLGSGKGYKMKEILNLLLSRAHKKITIQIGQSLLRPIDNPILVCDASKFYKLTGWKPKIALTDTLDTVLDYWRRKV
ncbi:GDP-mannose 4,6-dehydratase [Candidatus Roizmanbacteria bacterium]|nr:GDP-mannose 4,6-dehydratase [Candidatus Roizmanbacteria bacterium]